ncbi:uncharacterized protein [Pleurodeles waltl]|uniref:uncharacterized protein n=1 Tax=Pleurodeles waltl TaxID=8319 RepID=UPI003709BB45
MGLVEQLVEEAIIGTDFSEFPQVLDSLRQLEETNNWWKDAPFSSEPLSPPRVRPKLSRKEKRIMKKAYTQDLSSTPRVCHLPGDLMGQADYLSRFPDLVGLDQPHSCEGMCNRAPPDAASPSKKTIAKGYPGGTRGIPDVMTSHVIRQTRTADERQAERDREREADVKQSRREERHGSPRGKGSPAVDEDQREESGKPWAPPAPAEAKSGDPLQAGHVPGGAWPSQVRAYRDWGWGSGWLAGFKGVKEGGLRSCKEGEPI